MLRRSLKVVLNKILNHLQLVQLSTGDDGFHKYNNLGYVHRLKELYQKFSSAAAQSRTTQKCWTYLATRSVLDQFHFSLFWLRQVLQFTSLPGASGLGAKSVLAHVQISLIYGRPHCSLFFPVFSQKTSFSLVKSRLALGSPGWLVLHSVGCHYARNGLIYRKIIVDFPLVVTSICDTIFKTIPDQK